MRFKVLVLTLFMVVFMVGTAKANDTEIIQEGSYLSGIFFASNETGGGRKYQQARFKVRRSDEQIIYCVEYAVSVNGDNYNISIDPLGDMNLTQEQWDRMTLLSYYGYLYGNHTSVKWYAVTQYLIWKTVNPNRDIFFTDTLNGNRITVYTDEMNELETLVSNHYLEPSFSNGMYNLSIGEELIITDTNNVLSRFDVISNDNISYIRDGNTLKIKPNTIGKYEISLVNSDKVYNTIPILYVNPNSQNMMGKGSYNSINIKISLNVTGGEININKYGEELVISDNTYYYNEIKLGNVVYELYANDDIYVGDSLKYHNKELVKVITLDDTGYYKLSDLYFGSYCLIEKSNDNIHVLDNNSYCFELNDKEEFTFKNYLPKGKLEFVKKDSSTNEVISGVEIEIYDEKDNLIYKGTTDENGNITIDNLYLGKFYIVETISAPGYVLNNEKVFFEIKEDSEVIEVTMLNEKDVMPNTSSLNSNNTIKIIITIFIIIIMLLLIILNKEDKKIFYIIEVICILIVFLLVGTLDYNSLNDQKKHDKYIEEYFEDKMLEQLGTNISNESNYAGYIEIEKYDIKRLIINNDNTKSLDDGYVGINRNSISLDKQYGNVILAGHNRKNIFEKIKYLNIKDEIKITTVNNIYFYEVIDKVIVDETDFNYLRQIDNDKILTLITCTDEENKRLLVISRIKEMI